MCRFGMQGEGGGGGGGGRGGAKAGSGGVLQAPPQADAMPCLALPHRTLTHNMPPTPPPPRNLDAALPERLRFDWRRHCAATPPRRGSIQSFFVRSPPQRQPAGCGVEGEQRQEHEQQQEQQQHEQQQHKRKREGASPRREAGAAAAGGVDVNRIDR